MSSKMKYGILIVVLLICDNAHAKTIEELTYEIFGDGKDKTYLKPNLSTLTPTELTTEKTTTETNLQEESTEDECNCTPYYLCQNGTVNTNGEGIIDIRQLGPCSNYLDVCCKKEFKTEVSIKPTPSTKRIGCGQYNRDGKAFKIIGNLKNEANFAEFPWMVAILYEETNSKTFEKSENFQCGGALINTQVVLTAAHCVNSVRQFKIRAGEWDTRNTKEIYPYQERDVASIEIHPDFYEPGLYNDIALLFLKSPVKIAENINVVCLPKKEAIFDYANCFATGWGKSSFGQKNTYSNILKKISLPIVPENECQSRLRTTRLGSNFVLHSSFICAGGEQGHDTCEGDGGSPLVCPIPGQENRYQQAGIVSWGIGCGRKNPAAYSNVALFRDWIDQRLKVRGLNIFSYQF